MEEKTCNICLSDWFVSVNMISFQFHSLSCRQHDLALFFSLATGIWTQRLIYARQVLCHLSHTSVSFAFVIFQIESFILSWVRPGTVILLPIASLLLVITGTCYQT
jgi:hypothetical protein